MLNLECCSQNSCNNTMEFPQDFLTQSDVGKLVMNKNGKAVVVNPDTPRPSNYGRWQLTVTNVLEAPVPTEISLKFLGTPSENDFLRLGMNVFTFRTIANSPNDILINDTNISLQLNEVVAKLSTRYSGLWVVSNDGIDTVTIQINSPYYSGLNNVFNNLQYGLFYPPFQQPDQWEVSSNNINGYNSIAGQAGKLISLNESAFNGLINLTYYEFMNTALPNGTQLFGLKFPTTTDELAENLELTINSKYSGNLSAARAGNVITLTSLTDPTNPDEARIELTGDAPNYFTLTTLEPSIAGNGNIIADPILGCLIGISNGMALVGIATVQKLILAGTESVSVIPAGNNLGSDTVTNRLLIATNDGKVETFQSWKDAHPSANFDRHMLYHIANFGAIWWALSSANPGDEVLASINLPVASVAIMLDGLF